MYSLTYETLIQILLHLAYSGELRAKIPAQALLKGGGEAVLLVQKGKIISCSVFHRNGNRWYGDVQAQRLLLRLGVVNWQVASSTGSQTTTLVSLPTVPGTTSARRAQDLIPQNLPGFQTQMSTWSILERSVFSLADGTRTIEQIATLLSRPIETIIQVIYKLDKSGTITWHQN